MYISIPPLSEETAQATAKRLNTLAKVPGSLGKLEELTIRLAAMTGQVCPVFPKKSVVLFAADHGIAQNGLSATGQEVTALQVRNFLSGGGTINAFTRNAGAELVVVDVGVLDDFAPLGNSFSGDASLDAGLNKLIRRKVMAGANDFSRGPAMSREQALACLQVGIDMAHVESKRGITLLAAGEMGIGNTSPSSAIASILTGASVEDVTGAGSGISTAALSRKIDLINQALTLHFPPLTKRSTHDPIEILARVGGPEIGAIAGLMLGGASLRIPVVVDGFIAGAAAALAVHINPDVSGYLIGSHCSTEPGHRLLMNHIGVEPFFDFGLRLGEGTGAALMFPIIDASVRILHEMRTLTEIGLS